MTKLYFIGFLLIFSGCYITNDTTGFQCDELYMSDYNCNLSTSYNFIQFTPRVPRSPYWDAWGYPTQYYYQMGCPEYVVFPNTTYVFPDQEQTINQPRPSFWNSYNVTVPEPERKPKPQPNLSHEGNRLQPGEYRTRNINGVRGTNTLNKPNAPSINKKNN